MQVDQNGHGDIQDFYKTKYYRKQAENELKLNWEYGAPWIESNMKALYLANWKLGK